METNFLFFIWIVNLVQSTVTHQSAMGKSQLLERNLCLENFLNNILHAFLEYKLMTKLIFIYILQLPLALID